MPPVMIKFVLASASPARKKLLETVGINPIVTPSGYDESSVTLSKPYDLAATLAERKATVVAQLYKDALVLGCDSLLEVEGQIYGKPADAKEAISRWQLMRGKKGLLYTGHALIDTTRQRKIVRCAVTEVYFSFVTDSEIEAYVATGEPLRCAGCFALEGKGGLFIDRIVGCHSNVIGLSLPLLRTMLADLGYTVLDFWGEKSVNSKVN